MKLIPIVLAAGQGKRMRSALPKVLHQLADKSLLQHVIDTTTQLQTLYNQSIQQLYVVYGHGGDAVCQAVQQWQNAYPDCKLNLVEQVQQLGTGHAVAQAMPLIGNEATILVLYGDVPLIQAQTLMRLCSLLREKTLALLTVTVANPQGYGRIVRNTAGEVVKIVEEKDANDVIKQLNEVNTGILAVSAAALRRWLANLNNHNAQKEYYLTDIIAAAVSEGFQIATCQPETEQEVLGVNDRVQLAQLERHYQHRTVQQLMQQGVTFRDPNRVDIRGQLTVGQDVEIDIDVIIEGQVHLGDRVKVGAFSLLKNVKIGQDTVILSHCVLEDAQVGQEVKIGPFARLRPETQLADKVHIGNFVEIKKSKVANASKINHLTYIGDSEIGQNVNVGAGTITCNYDGVNKFKTIIGDNAFIGSATQLVAPVTVGEGATIGAGSTITRDAPADKLTLSRPSQQTIGHWQRPIKK